MLGSVMAEILIDEAPKHYAEAPDHIDDLTAIDRHPVRSGK